MNAAAGLPRWIDDAACVNHPPHLFFGSRIGAAEDAKAVCASCPVAGLCLEFGLTEPAGIYGGLGPKARKRLRRELRRSQRRGTTT